MAAAALAAELRAEGNALDPNAIQAAIDTASASGGGRVVVPAGDWETCPLRLGSNVELHLEAGARLLASTNRSGYATLPVGYSEGALFGVVSAMGVTNVSITGCGEIVGRGEMWPQPGEYGGNQEGGRPRGIVFAACRDVRLADFTLRDSPCWGIVLKNCDGVIARRVKIDSHCNANNDGFDIEARNVRIEDCDVDTGDDAFCLKSNDPGFVMTNVVIRNCVGRSNCNAFKIGTASHGTVRHIRFENCRTEAPRRSFLSRVTAQGMPKAGTDWFYFNRTQEWAGGPEHPAGMCGVAVECVDGGEVSDVVCAGLDIRGMMTPIFIRGGTRTGRSCGTPPGSRHVLRDVVISNVTAVAESFVASSITGVQGCRPANIRLQNVTIRCKPGELPSRTDPVPERAGAYPEGNMFGVLPTRGLYLRHADGVALEDVTCVGIEDVNELPIAAEDVKRIQGE